MKKSPKLNSFSLTHYAGKVTYNVDEFMEKNTDTMLPKLYIYDLSIRYEMFSYSENKFISTLFNMKDIQTIKDSISKSFTIQIQRLMNLLKQTKSRYIRCIKPNFNKKAHDFNVDYCLEQVREYLKVVNLFWCF